MPSLRQCFRVYAPTSARTLGYTAGLSGSLSLRGLLNALCPPFGPRPFYIVDHNTNTIPDVNAALDAGANAIEPDVNIYLESPNSLCISHDLGHAEAPPLVQYLTELRQVALTRPQLALVVFDCKVFAPNLGARLLNSIRTILMPDTGLNVIISVPDLQSTILFDQIGTGLRPREGLMIDAENDPDSVATFFTDRGVARQCYGNGISVLNEILGPNVRPSMEAACTGRAVGRNAITFIYVWTVNDGDLQREYIRIGVDGIISDDLGQLRSIVQEPEFATQIRPATRADNPFLPPLASYGLTIHTSDVSKAGTDANVTFTLNGDNGSVSVTVDTSYHGRMESNRTNFITLQSPDLGRLQSITVQRDDSGNAPDWRLDSIVVESYRYSVNQRADLNRWIGTSPVTQTL